MAPKPIRVTVSGKSGNDISATSNVEIERHGYAVAPNEADLSKSSTPLLGPSKLLPAIAPTDC
jgi:hypothetical protein